MRSDRPASNTEKLQALLCNEVARVTHLTRAFFFPARILPGMENRRAAKNDCLRQSLARVLDLPIHKVPHFVKKHRGRWSWYLCRWLERRGYSYVFCPARCWTFPRQAMVSGDFKRWVLIGFTKAHKSHAVVVEADKGVVYDGGNPLKSTVSCFFIFKRKR